MDFTLVSSHRTQHFSGDAVYRFDRFGLLVISDGRGKQFTYSPSAWSYIEEEEPESGALRR